MDMSERVSKHFRRREFACRCGCGASDVSIALLEVLERIREHFDSPVTITSGRRCTKHNAKVGGAPGSQHLQGTAADIQVPGVTPETLYSVLSGWYPRSLGLGLYPGRWVHVDVRQCMARWEG